MALKLTDKAVEAVKVIVASADATGADSGLRIVADRPDDGPPSFALSVVAAPIPDDHVIEDGGARVFLASDASELLDETTLDAHFVDDQRISFVLSDRP